MPSPPPDHNEKAVIGSVAACRLALDGHRVLRCEEDGGFAPKHQWQEPLGDPLRYE